MANSGREALLHSAMDQMCSRVRKWKAGSGPMGPSQAQDLCSKHKDDIYTCFQESGLQAWEFHTMLHRAAEYGLVEDMKGLWSEVATTFLQLRSGSGSFEPPAQQQSGFSQQQPQQQAQQQAGPKANGAYSTAYPANGRSTSNSSSATSSKPPGLNRQATQGTAYAAAPNRSPQDDVAGTSTDQHSNRKQQQQQQQQQQKPAGRSASAGKGAAVAGYQQQQQQGKGAAGKQQQQASTAAGAGSKAGATAAAAAAPAGAADAAGMPNGYISAWRNGLDTAGNSKGGSSLMTGFMSGPGYHQQLPQQQQQGMDQLQAQGMEQQQEEPLDLLPLGLLDDVYDQGDAVVDAPLPKSGKAGGAAAGGRGGQPAARQQQSKQQQGKLRTQQQQQQPPQQQARAQQKPAAANAAQPQQQQAQGRSAGANAAGAQLPQQQEAAGFEAIAVSGGTLSPTARPFPAPLSLGPFATQQQQQQQQQQPPQLGYDMTSPLSGLQQRASLEEQLHQQQLLMLQQQARYYQQQQQQQQQHMGMWGTSPHMPYMHPLTGTGAGLPMQPPPPPRSSSGNGAAAGQAGAAAAAAAAAGPQQAPGNKPGYAAVAAGLSAAPGSGMGAAVAAPAGSVGEASHISDVGGLGVGHTAHSGLSSGPLSYRSSLGLSAAPGGPLGAAAGADTRQQNGQCIAPGGPVSAAHQQQQLQGHGSLSEPAHGSLLSASSGPLLQQHIPGSQQQQGLLGMQQHGDHPTAAPFGSSSSSKGLGMPSGLSLFQGAAYDSPLNGPLMGSSSTGAAVGGGPLSPYPSPMHRSLSGVPSGGASPALTSLAASGPQGSSNLGMAPMLLPPSALGAIGEPVGSHSHGAQQQQQQQAAAAPPRPAWGGAPGRVQQAPAEVPLQQEGGTIPGAGGSMGGAVKQQGAAAAPAGPQQQQQHELQVGSLGSTGSSRGGLVADSSSSSASSSITAPAATSVATSPHSVSNGSPSGLARPPQQQQPQQQQQQVQGGSPVRRQQQQQQQVPASPGKPLTWAQKLKKAETGGGPTPNGPPAAASAATAHAAGGWGGAAAGAAAAPGPRIARAPQSELSAAAAAASGAGGAGGRGQHKTTGQALLAAAKQQEEEAAAAAAAAVPTYSEAAALEGLDETTAKAAVTAASRMPLPAKLIQAWRSGLCLGSLIKLLQSQRPDLATAVNDRIKGWLCQDCDRSTAECLVLFVLANLRRDWHMTAKNPGAFLMGLLQHRAALIGGSGLSRKLLETARNFPNVAVYIDSDVLQELGDMEPELRGFVMDEYMCKQRHDWPEGLKFPSQCLLSCMRSIRYADPAVHRAYMQLLASRPDLSKACNGVILYGLCKCDKGTGLAAVKRLSELPEAWTSAARVNASAFLYQKVQELCGGHGCY